MNDHPYRDAADHRRWRTAVTTAGAGTDPATGFPFRIDRDAAVMTAGSCFAQHVGGRLRARGYHVLDKEHAHPLMTPDDRARFGYGLFSARYGNVYTARQLLQLFRRAQGVFSPAEDRWQSADGAIVDPFRPLIQPGGFATDALFERDRARHLAAVKRAFATADVLMFTLGLTESWESAIDGAVFPSCPGTAGGRFDPALHRFRNHSVDEVAGDLRALLREVRAVNPGLRMILTVSPVPLVATATDLHVLTASTLSKAVLRVAAGLLAAEDPAVGYFPSFEIVTGPQSGGRYIAADLREVTAEGVDRVMSLFFRNVGVGDDGEEPAGGPATIPVDTAAALVGTLCDEAHHDGPVTS